MKQNWYLIAGILALLAVPFGLAAFEDSTKEPAPAAKDIWNEDDPTTGSDDDETGGVLLQKQNSRNNVVAEWKTEEPLDLSFLEDYLVTPPGVSEAITVANRSDDALDDFDTDSPHWESVDLTRYSTGQNIATVAMMFAAEYKVLDKLTERWGPPSRKASPPGRSASWETASPTEVSPTRVVFSADGDPQRILVGPMTTVEAVLGRGFFGKRARFKSLQQLDSEFPNRDDDGDSLESRAIYLPPVAESLEPNTEIWFSSGDSSNPTKITNVSLAVQLDLAPRSTNEMLALLKKAFGKPRASKFGDDALELTFAKHPGLSVFLYANRLVVEQEL